MAQTFHVRPSELLGLRGNDPRALFLDRAITFFGRSIEDDQESAVKRLPKKASETMQTNARRRILDAYLGIDPTTTPGRFRDPATSGHTRRRASGG